MILKRQQRFKSDRHDVFTEEINKIGLSSNDDKRMQLINSIETYVYEMREDLVCKKEENKSNNIIKNTKIINSDDVTKENLKFLKLICMLKIGIKQNINC